MFQNERDIEKSIFGFLFENKSIKLGKHIYLRSHTLDLLKALAILSPPYPILLACLVHDFAAANGQKIELTTDSFKCSGSYYEESAKIFESLNGYSSLPGKDKDIVATILSGLGGDIEGIDTGLIKWVEIINREDIASLRRISKDLPDVQGYFTDIIMTSPINGESKPAGIYKAGYLVVFPGAMISHINSFFIEKGFSLSDVKINKEILLAEFKKTFKQVSSFAGIEPLDKEFYIDAGQLQYDDAVIYRGVPKEFSYAWGEWPGDIVIATQVGSDNKHLITGEAHKGVPLHIVEKLDTLEEEHKSHKNEVGKLNERLKQYEDTALIDEVTGIPNRKELERRLNGAMAKYQRQNIPFCVLMTDIDKFKKFNDDYGHSVGDLVLKVVAQTMANQIRTNDSVCRYGGEEIVVILDNTHSKEGMNVAEKIRTAVENEKVETDKGVLGVTVSIGVSCVSDMSLLLQETEKLTIDMVTAAADKALYTSKEKGRNRVTLSEGADGR